CPGFSADCLETLEEIGHENRRYFLDAGGGSYEYIPALNLRADHLEALAGLVIRHIQGWPEADPEWDPGRREEWARMSLKLAKEQGAER
ncbi:MAG TPA: ferrochelatase, partial [Gammaproteobacteria bacterium]|nr:ferrochelatase [Gammaproteobacteria bacterium]